MKPIIYGFALAPALVAGTWLILSASMSSAETVQPAGDTTTMAGPRRLAQAQAEAEAEADDGAEAVVEVDDEADAEPVEQPVSYTNEQADRGEKEFKQECEECHGDDLRGGLNGGPPLRGLAFEEKYADGLTASLLFGFMSSTMPPHAPGRLSPSTYADLMAYILQQNGFQPGAPLPSDLDALGYLIMEK